MIMNIQSYIYMGLFTLSFPSTVEVVMEETRRWLENEQLSPDFLLGLITDNKFEAKDESGESSQ